MHHAAACFCFTLHFIHCVLLFERCYAFDPGPHGLEVKYKQASKQAEAAAFASMEGRGADARIAGAAAFASMEGRGADARVVGELAFASMEGRGADARIVGELAFANTESIGTRARSARAVDFRLRWASQHKRLAAAK